MNSEEDLAASRMPNANFGSELEWLIFYMWLKPANFRFRIPDTVIMRRDKTQGLVLGNWYFSTAQGRILKKNRVNCTVPKISSQYCGKFNSNFEPVAATAYHYDIRSDDTPGMVKKDILTLEHIAVHDFKSFCQMLEQLLEYGCMPGS